MVKCNQTGPFQGQRSHLADPALDETRLFPGLLGSFAVIHISNRQVWHSTAPSSGWPHRMPWIAKHAFPIAAWLQPASWCARRCPSPSSLDGTETVHSSRLGSPWLFHVLCSVSCWTWAPRAQGKKAQWQQLAGALVCPRTQSQQLVLFPLQSRCARPHMATLPRTLSCLGTGTPVMFSFSTLPRQTFCFFFLLLLFCFVLLCLLIVITVLSVNESLLGYLLSLEESLGGMFGCSVVWAVPTPSSNFQVKTKY